MPSDYKAITKYNEEQLGKDTSSRKTQVSMYSDPTHFVYEILQNADDYGATEVLFKLSEDDIVIEHNGEPFKEENVKAITYFGKSTSREDLVKTGRFGIGFKSVFAFTATPIIISYPEHFQIYGLYRIREYPYPEGFPRPCTRIILPFNHDSEQPDFVEELMSKEEAYQQISECLVGLDMNTLLFTRNIREIRWEIGSQSECYSREDEVNDNARLTTIKDDERENTYIVFSKIPDWKNQEHKAVEIAFAVDAQHQLVPIHNEFLHVLFPTTERTDLRFILNGPYRTNPARETISRTDAFNLHLMKVTCELMKKLLPKLRDKKFLTLQFLSILPNEEDILHSFYAPLRDIVVDEFRNQKLTPTKRGDHAPASELYRVSTELLDLIGDEDLAILLGKDCSLPFKVDEIAQRRDARGRFVQDPNAQFIDDFLNTLQIPDWDMTKFASTLLAQPEIIKTWLGTKSVENHQTLYALLYDFLGLRWTGNYWYSSKGGLKNRLSDLPIIPCSDDIYRPGGKCFFPSDDVKRDEDFPRVLKDVYSSGQDDDQKSKARDFLEAINVRSVDEAIEVEAILRQRYEDSDTEISSKLHEEDMKIFIALVEQDPDKVILFQDYRVFRTADRGSFDGGFYHKASIIFLDSPYLETGLKVYYEDNEYWEFVCEGNVEPYLSLDYEKSNIDLKKLGRFAETLGAKTTLKVDDKLSTWDHPKCDEFRSVGTRNWSDNTGVDQDYRIPEFQLLIHSPSIVKAKLIWQAMCSVPDHYLKAEFRWNQANPPQVDCSSLVYELRDAEWIPQKKNNSKISFVKPCDAYIERLPEGFPYQTEQKWLEAIKFGAAAKERRLENIRKETERNQKNQNAKEFGFGSANEAKNAAEFFEKKGVSAEESLKKLQIQERRKELLIIELSDAGEKIYKILPKSIKVTGNTIDQKTVLKERYTTDENRMCCQMCSKGMPFKNRNGDQDYFEAVEALGKGHFFKEHEAQYLALCPECAAEYKEYVKKDPKARETFHNALKNSDSPQIHLESHGRTIRIWFQKKHWQDLKTVLYYYENVYDSDEVD